MEEMEKLFPLISTYLLSWYFLLYGNVIHSIYMGYIFAIRDFYFWAVIRIAILRGYRFVFP